MKKSTPRKQSLAAHPVAKALRLAGPVPHDTVQRLQLREWSAIESFAQGRATITDLRMLREVLPMCAASVDFGIGPEAEPVCHEAAMILASIGQGKSADALLRMDAAQVAVMRELQGYHNLQRAASTWGQYGKIIERATELLDGLPDPAPPPSVTP